MWPVRRVDSTSFKNDRDMRNERGSSSSESEKGRVAYLEKAEAVVEAQRRGGLHHIFTMIIVQLEIELRANRIRAQALRAAHVRRFTRVGGGEDRTWASSNTAKYRPFRYITAASEYFPALKSSLP